MGPSAESLNIITTGIFAAAAMCIVPVLPPIYILAFDIIAHISRKVVFPQRFIKRSPVDCFKKFPKTSNVLLPK